MADPLSIIAFSLAGLHGCVKALVVISKARCYTDNVKDAQVRTSLMLHALTSWATQVGLGNEPPSLFVNIKDAPIVPTVLERIEALFSNINELSIRHGSELRMTDEHIDDCDDNEKTLVPIGPRKSWVNKIIRNAYLKRAQPWKRLKWVAIDDEKFSRLLGRARSYVSELEKFLEQAKQEKMRAQMEMLLRRSILDADERQSGIIVDEGNDVYSQDSVAAVARFKQMRLTVDTTNDDLTSSAATTSMSGTVQYPLYSRSPTQATSSRRRRSSLLQIRLLTLSRKAQFQPTRTLAQYSGQVVLLEWKHVTSVNDLRTSQRVEQVAALLNSLGPSLHSLQCRGFVKDHINSRYGFVFDLPHEQNLTLRRTMSLGDGTSAAHTSNTEVKSLREMFDGPSPSLNTKLSIAVTLLETLLNIHNAGWLHKELHSASVILVRKVTPNEEHDPDLSSYTTYITGFVSSRADSADEMTETLRSEGEANLYRHPSLLSNTRQPYRKSFDIFSVGCTLLEVGLWTRLQDILQDHSRLEDEVPRPLARHMSDPSVPPMNSLLDGRATREAGESPRIDLTALTRQLLSISVQNTDVGMSASALVPRGKILSALQCAMGKKYTGIVETLLAVSVSTKTHLDDEDESVLNLEMRARDVMQSIADAI